MKEELVVLVFVLSLTLVNSLETIPMCSRTTIEGFKMPNCTTDPEASMSCIKVQNITRCTQSCRCFQTIGGPLKSIQCTADEGPQNCTETCQASPTTCRGDSLYCDYIGQMNCQSNSATKLNRRCVCTIVSYTETKQCDYHGTWITRDEINVLWSAVVPQFHQPAYNPRPFEPRQGKKRVVFTHIDFTQPNLIVATPYPTWTFVWAKKDGVNKLFTCAMSSCTIILQDSFFLNPGTLDISVYINDTLDNTASFEVVSFEKCDIPRCIFCRQMWNSFGCFPGKFQSVLLLLTFSAVLMLIVTGILVYMIIKNCLCSRCRQPMQMNLVMNNLQTRDGRIAADDQLIVLDDQEEGEPVERPARQRRGRGIRQLLGLHILMLLIAAASAASCSSGINIASSGVVCQVSGTTETCNVQFTQTITIPGPGLSACFSITNDNNVVIGQLFVDYNQALDKVVTATQYYTAAWTGSSTSERQCPWETGCATGSVCSDYNGVSDPTAGGLLGGTSVQWPGVSVCTSTCGCAGCGCFACDSSCMYSRYARIPTGDPIQVLAPVSRTLEPHIGIRLVTDSGTTSINTSLIGFDQQVGEDYTVQIVGSLQGSTTIFGTNKIVKTSDSAYIMPACDVNQPVSRSVGDIQASTSNKLMTASTNAFIYPPNSVTISVGTYGVTYQFPPAGTTAITSYQPLPQVIGSILWSFSPTELIGLNTNPGALVLTIATARPITFARQVNVVCPKISSATLTGCFSCAQGAVLTVVARSTCSPGAASVTIGNFVVNTPSVNLATADGQVLIHFASSVASVSSSVKLQAGPYSDEISFSGTLQEPNLVSNATDDVQNNGVGSIFGALDPSKINEWFQGLGDSIKIIIIIAAVVIALILIGVIIYFIWRAVPKNSGYSKIHDATTQEAAADARKEETK